MSHESRIAALERLHDTDQGQIEWQEKEIAALRIVLAGYVRDIEQAHARVAAYQSALNDMQMERENLMEQVQELRNRHKGTFIPGIPQTAPRIL